MKYGRFDLKSTLGRNVPDEIYEGDSLFQDGGIVTILQNKQPVAVVYLNQGETIRKVEASKQVEAKQ